MNALDHGSSEGGLWTTLRTSTRARIGLGRAGDALPTDLAHLLASASDIGIVLADGLSAHALEEHGVPAARVIVAELPRHLSVAQPVIATSARVALGDHIGAALDVQTVVVLIGERPGLSFADSLGLYVTHHPRPGPSDSERNCVSNVNPPDGLGYAQAARVVASPVDGARRLGRSGVELEDTSERAAVEGADTGRGSGG